MMICFSRSIHPSIGAFSSPSSSSGERCQNNTSHIDCSNRGREENVFLGGEGKSQDQDSERRWEEIAKNGFIHEPSVCVHSFVKSINRLCLRSLGARSGNGAPLSDGTTTVFVILFAK